MTAPCTLTGAPPRVSPNAWAYIPGDSVILHQAMRNWPADLEFQSPAARDKWESVQRTLETVAEFPELAQRMAYRQAHPDDAESAMSRLILDNLRQALERADRESDGQFAAAAREEAWDRARKGIDNALRRVKWGK